jgi:hypothetical protein
MGLKIVSAKVTGNPGKAGWAQVHDFEPQDSGKLEARGRFFAVISASADAQDFDYISFGREILARLHEEYFGDLKKEAFDALKNAVEKVAGEFTEKLSGLEIAASSYVNGVVYSAVYGGAQASVFRGGMLATILKSQPTGVISASGYPKEGDVFVIATRDFFSEFTDSKLEEILFKKDLSSAGQTIALSIYAKEGSSRMAAALVKFSSRGEILKNLVAETAPEGETKIKKIPSYLAAGLKSFAGNILGRLPRRQIYIKQPLLESSDESKKTTLTAGVVLIIILFLSIFFGVRQKLSKDRRSSYQQELTTATHSLDEAKNLKQLSPERARELFLESKSIVDGLLSKGVKDKDVNALKTEIEKNRGDILAEYEANPELFIDLSLLSSGFKADALAFSSDYMAALDVGGKRVAKVALATKKAEMVAGPTDLTDQAKDIALYTDEVYLSTDTKIYTVDNGLKEVAAIEAKGASSIYAYAGNLYLLDKQGSKILRYQAISSGFAPAKDWLGTGQTFDFSKVAGWTIDGSIWLGYSNGMVQRLTQGVVGNFNVPKIDPKIESIDSIYSNEELEGLYLLDRANKRILVLSKDGVFKASYQNDTLSMAKHVAASEKLKKIFFSDDAGRVYSVEIKHLK